MNACFSKFWKPPRQDTGSFEDWWKFGNWQKISEFLKLGVGLVTCWQISHSNKQKITLVWLGPKEKKKGNQLHFNGKTSTWFPPYHRKACLSRIQWRRLNQVKEIARVCYINKTSWKNKESWKTCLELQRIPLPHRTKSTFSRESKMFIIHCPQQEWCPLFPLTPKNQGTTQKRENRIFDQQNIELKIDF